MQTLCSASAVDSTLVSASSRRPSLLLLQLFFNLHRPLLAAGCFTASSSSSVGRWVLSGLLGIFAVLLGCFFTPKLYVLTTLDIREFLRDQSAKRVRNSRREKQGNQSSRKQKMKIAAASRRSEVFKPFM
ncbi:hypothetical protein QN277_009995 [Acacia crassicarpa]|uniref:Transmembrane protein n=1 Tax=Acacia crassicarpa TaxID=499986 RepID=A0AAE1IQX4_9FABA|nr:hypothetical protein QN277_009995 [Acacia crassicarpa]